MIFDDQHIDMNSLDELRDTLGIKRVEFNYLLGIINFCGFTQITNPIAILARTLDKYPEYNFLPTPPKWQDIYNKVKDLQELKEKVLPPHKRNRSLNIHEFAILLGHSKWFGKILKKQPDKEFKTIIYRILQLLEKILEKDGVEGLKRYLHILEIEAKLQGKKNLEELFKFGWIPRSSVNKCESIDEIVEKEKEKRKKVKELIKISKQKQQEREKAIQQDEQIEFLESKEEEPKKEKKRKRGRPRKNPIIE